VKTIRFPVLVERDGNESHSMHGHDIYHVGRSQGAELPILDLQCSRKQFQIENRPEGSFLVHVSTSSPTICNGVLVKSPVQLKHGDVINAGLSTFVVLLHDGDYVIPSQTIAEIEMQSTSVGMPVAQSIAPKTIMASSSNLGAVPTTADFDQKIEIVDNLFIGRDNTRATVILHHPQVSRLHAQIAVRNQIVTIADLGSANGTFVNGRKIASTRILEEGDSIDIGPYVLVLTNNSLVSRSRAHRVQLTCKNLTRVVKSGESGRQIAILNDVTVTFDACEFVCILGPSGSGKSTLLNALSARIPADHGTVTLNDEDLYSNFHALKRDIAVVPQNESLHEFLSVETALQFTGQLRLPSDTTKDEIQHTVSEMLTTVGLSNRAGTKISNLSGGQLKRASLANEIISQPGLLFLDEVTSGLDEQTDAEMMSLFRTIAENGKTVICITHSLANVESNCHKLVILTEGGFLAFVGTPKDACSYFGITRLGEIYAKLQTRRPKQWQEAFADTQVPRAASEELDSQVEQTQFNTIDTPISEKLSLFARQTEILLRRYAKIQVADRLSMILMLGQCLLVGALMVLLFGDIGRFEIAKEAGQSVQILFLLGISTFWFGCSNAAKEIVKESQIYIRERDVNLLVESYLASKLLLLGFVSVVQASILYCLVSFGTGLEMSLGQLVLLLGLAFAGVSMGILISTVSKTTDMAVTIVPLVLIPQIIFSGALCEVEGIAQLLAGSSIVVYWAHGGLVETLPTALTEIIDQDGWSQLMATAMVFLHSAVYTGVAFAILVSRAREERYAKAIEKIFATANAVRSKTRGRQATKIE
jgi:ABC-type multidrug transport system ATPase subunit/pSer/pThr/pTyr-binding forkhead associated (FHA) protein